ncbi:MAG: glycoside hydrolase family 15 protein, partial [Candidatus Xenobia bacterium]
YLSWLLHPDRLTRNRLQVLYTVHGDWDVPEQELPHLDGYRGSRPVRLGNAAHSQLQLDTYGELIFAAVEYVRRGGKLDRSQLHMLARLSRAICAVGDQPDDGIWESRGGRRMHTFSKVMCAEALDWLLEMQKTRPLDIDATACRQMCDRLRHEIETRGYNPQLGSYVTEFDGSQVDASLFLLDYYGYLPSTHPRIRSTHDYLHRVLCTDDLCLRYTGSLSDGLPPGEGYFGICSFWSVAARARQGHVEEAMQGFEQLLRFANDVGLFAEEIGDHGEALGNFPQAFTHVGVIDAALAISAQLGRYSQGHAEQHTDHQEGVRTRA